MSGIYLSLKLNPGCVFLWNLKEHELISADCNCGRNLKRNCRFFRPAGQAKRLLRFHKIVKKKWGREICRVFGLNITKMRKILRNDCDILNPDHSGRSHNISQAAEYYSDNTDVVLPDHVRICETKNQKAGYWQLLISHRFIRSFIISVSAAKCFDLTDTS